MNTLDGMSFGQRLKRERIWHDLTQEELAEKLGISSLSIIRSENEKGSPHPRTRRAMYEFFGKTAETFGMQTVRFWHVPVERNPYFIGRDDVLEMLHKALVIDGSIAITQQALTGLGGIGKTQIAVEYAYRFAHEYRAVLWVRADSPELLDAEFASLMAPLHLKEMTVANQQQAIHAVRHWLQAQPSWLLIFDNVEDVAILSKYIPTLRNGSILITTRVHSKQQHIKKLIVEKLTLEESMFLLFLRARFITSSEQLAVLAESEYQAAEQLCTLLDGLPLALEQAAAYIEVNQGSVAEYLKLFQTYHVALFALKNETKDTQKSITTTWNISFDRLVQRHPLSADLLRACAFLHPDAIPEELFLKGGDCLSPHLRSINELELKALIEPLLSLSLVQRDKSNRTLLMHRLVQMVLQSQMSKDVSDEWARRVIRAINNIFPKGDFASWPLCERYFAHVQMCIALIEQKNILIPEGVALLNRVGYYLKERSQYKEALSLLKSVVDMSERIFGPEHLYTADVLHNLAATCRELTMHTEAKPLYERTLAIRRRRLEMQHPDIARTLTELADFYMQTKEFQVAEQYYLQAHAMYEITLGVEHLETLRNLNLLSELYYYRGRVDEAEQIEHRIVKVQVRTLGVTHPETIGTVHNIAFLYGQRGHHGDAIQLFWLTFFLNQQQLGLNHRLVATNLHNIADRYKILKRYAEAEALWQRVLVIRKHVLGEEHLDTLKAQRLLRELYSEQGIDAAVIESRIAELLLHSLPSQPLAIPIEYVEVVQRFCSNHTSLLESIYRNEDDHTHRCADHDATVPCESCKLSEHPVAKELVEAGARYPQ